MHVQRPDAQQNVRFSLSPEFSLTLVLNTLYNVACHSMNPIIFSVGTSPSFVVTCKREIEKSRAGQLRMVKYGSVLNYRMSDSRSA